MTTSAGLARGVGKIRLKECAARKAQHDACLELGRRVAPGERGSWFALLRQELAVADVDAVWRCRIDRTAIAELGGQHG
jgi:hypothetical protein